MHMIRCTITASKDIGHAADEFIEQLNKEETDQFRIKTDF
jgi:bifunctional enzyme Fae/Hps